MNSELLISLIPTITSVGAIIVAIISFIGKVKSIVKKSDVENIRLRKELKEVRIELRNQRNSNEELKEELTHVIKRMNKVKED